MDPFMLNNLIDLLHFILSLRIVELNSGSIKIDGIDIKELGLKKLRSIFWAIHSKLYPFGKFDQHCALLLPVKENAFSQNTNPTFTGDYDDSRLFKVLTHVGRFTPIEMISLKLGLLSLGNEKWTSGRTQPIKSLSDEVALSGNNFTVGQRQLLVIARAMLTGARIIIMDDATASVDADTDAWIQRVFWSELSEATCISVAHRLNTIMESDYVLVMDDGLAAEFDKPSMLLSKGDGIFKSLVDAWEEEN
ncbi:hypothetical protein ACHAW5_010595 [Stephanodiscus triporus]|uniref:ABC transporter domain-containing protein n=1 Tax=Stephanodiscus triporus TaxID=2934178 RepID=A0ABD3P313_9STRA